MSFVGELEHLPIVDVIQLLSSTRKSGTLCLKSAKGESQLVFSSGYIVGANHANTSVRIGQVLVEMKALTQHELDSALAAQNRAGKDRLPIIATLIESGKINKELAHKSLATLIQLTIVEVLTWTSGTFELDIDKEVICDEYLYLPEKLKQDICLDTQGLLMDALRIFDERMRDGTLTDETFTSGGFIEDDDEFELTPHEENSGSPSSTVSDSSGITADLLGLDDLDSIERKIPDVFLGVRRNDIAESQRKKIQSELQGISAEDQEKIVSYLREIEESKREPTGSKLTLAVVFFSQDELFRQIITVLCKHEGHLVFTADDTTSLNFMIENAFTKDMINVLIIDHPQKNSEIFSPAELSKILHEMQSKYMGAEIIQLISPLDWQLPLHALKSGATLLIPRPYKEGVRENFADDTINFLESVIQSLRKISQIHEKADLGNFIEFIRGMETLKEPPDIAFAVLRFVSTIYKRALTFVVGKTELIAERSFGVLSESTGGESPPLRFRIPIIQCPIISAAIENGSIFSGELNDQESSALIYSEIGAPLNKASVLIPIRNMGKTVALVYGDFGQNNISSAQTELVEAVALHAGLLLDNALFRKKFEQ